MIAEWICIHLFKSENLVVFIWNLNDNQDAKWVK